MNSSLLNTSSVPQFQEFTVQTCGGGYFQGRSPKLKSISAFLSTLQPNSKHQTCGGGYFQGRSPKLNSISAFLSTTAGKKAELFSCGLMVKARPKSSPFLENRISATRGERDCMKDGGLSLVKHIIVWILFYPGSRMFIPDPGCLFRIPDPSFFHPGSVSNIVSILTQKIVL